MWPRGGSWLQDEACQVSVVNRCKGFKVFKGLERLKGFERFRAGKRQTWTPIRSHCCALGVPVG